MGGAGTILKYITPAQEEAYKKGLKHALDVGYAAIEQNRNA